jgi:hypothetical protein
MLDALETLQIRLVDMGARCEPRLPGLAQVRQQCGIEENASSDDAVTQVFDAVLLAAVRAVVFGRHEIVEQHALQLIVAERVEVAVRSTVERDVEAVRRVGGRIHPVEERVAVVGIERDGRQRRNGRRGWQKWL